MRTGQIYIMFGNFRNLRVSCVVCKVGGVVGAWGNGQLSATGLQILVFGFGFEIWA